MNDEVIWRWIISWPWNLD